MNGEIEDGPETSSRGAGWGWVLWPAVVLLLYVLSIGPVLMMDDKNLIPNGSPAGRVLQIVYSPLEWAHENTPLRKPLEMYVHLWVPSLFNRKGNPK
jgi:hypothetical protein